MVDDLDESLASGGFPSDPTPSDGVTGDADQATTTEDGYGFESSGDATAVGGIAPPVAQDGNGPDDGKATAAEGGYGYEFSDDPQSSGGLGTGET